MSLKSARSLNQFCFIVIRKKFSINLRLLKDLFAECSGNWQCTKDPERNKDLKLVFHVKVYR